MRRNTAVHLNTAEVAHAFSGRVVGIRPTPGKRMAVRAVYGRLSSSRVVDCEARSGSRGGR